MEEPALQNGESLSTGTSCDLTSEGAASLARTQGAVRSLHEVIEWCKETRQETQVLRDRFDKVTAVARAGVIGRRIADCPAARPADAASGRFFRPVV